MPLSLRPPRAGKTPNFEIRGSYLGVKVEVSSGTHRRSVARQQLRKIEECIEQHGQYPAPAAPAPDPGQPTFLSASIAYMQAGGSRRFMAPLVRHFGETPIAEIDQVAIDTAAIEIYPAVTPATRARQVYTPVSAILHHHFGDKAPVVKRPKGSKGRTVIDFLWPEDAFSIIDEAEKIDAEFGLYLLTLLYTGIRKSEGLSFLLEDMRPDECAAWLRDSKNGDPRMLQLRAELARRMQLHLDANPDRTRVFRWKDGGYFKHLLMRAKLAACGLPCPKRRVAGWRPPPHRLAFVGFHTFRHTWATWMRRYGGADVEGLAATKNWRDPQSARRYAHVVQREEWQRVESLPARKAKEA